MAGRAARLHKKRCTYSVPHWGGDAERRDRAVPAVCGQLVRAKFSGLLEPDTKRQERAHRARAEPVPVRRPQPGHSRGAAGRVVIPPNLAANPRLSTWIGLDTTGE